MKRPTLRLSVFAATLALSTFSVCAVSQADSPKPFYSRLNPKNWFRKSEEPGKTKVSDLSDSKSSVSGETTVATRPQLKDDPFLVAPVADAPAPIAAAKKPAATDLPEIQPKAKAAPERQTAKAPSTKAPAASAARTPAKPRKNEFVEEFDGDFARLVESVRDDSPVESEESQAPIPRRSKPEAKTVAKSPTTTKPEAPLMPDLGGTDEAIEEVTESVSSLPPAAKKVAAKTPEVRGPRVVEKAEETVAESSNSADDFERFAAEQESKAVTAEKKVAKAAEPAKSLTAKTEAVTKITPEEAAAEAPAVADDFVASSRKEMDTALARTAQAQRAREAASKATIAATPEVKKPITLPKSEPLARPKPSLESVIARKTTPASDAPVKLLTPIDSSGLIVSNDLVPDRKLYTTSQAFQQAARSAKAEINMASNATVPAPVESQPEAKATERSGGGIIILPAKPPRELDKAPHQSTARVTANKAPVRTSPDGSKVQQLSYEDTASIETHLPVMSISPGKAAAPDSNGPLFILPKAESEETTAATTEKTTRASAPILEFPEETESLRPKKRGSSGWVLATLAFIAAGCGIGVMIRKKGQLAAIAASPVNTAGENPAV